MAKPDPMTKALRKHRGDLSRALLDVTDSDSVAVLAERLGLSRSGLKDVLSGRRRSHHVRRALEAEAGLDPHRLDRYLP